mmetsp:Transcript_19591/g.51959  ORF Transcript_19591/g.51959 Transcript_19591/m.51959 type:complete len:369 (+) Transcript_19591:232-1338(+)
MIYSLPRAEVADAVEVALAAAGPLRHLLVVAADVVLVGRLHPRRPIARSMQRSVDRHAGRDGVDVVAARPGRAAKVAYAAVLARGLLLRHALRPLDLVRVLPRRDARAHGQADGGQADHGDQQEHQDEGHAEQKVLEDQARVGVPLGHVDEAQEEHAEQDDVEQEAAVADQGQELSLLRLLAPEIAELLDFPEELDKLVDIDVTGGVLVDLLHDDVDSCLRHGEAAHLQRLAELVGVDGAVAGGVDLAEGRLEHRGGNSRALVPGVLAPEEDVLEHLVGLGLLPGVRVRAGPGFLDALLQLHRLLVVLVARFLCTRLARNTSLLELHIFHRVHRRIHPEGCATKGQHTSPEKRYAADAREPVGVHRHG